MRGSVDEKVWKEDESEVPKGNENLFFFKFTFLFYFILLILLLLF